jgi:hypothetical protein
MNKTKFDHSVLEYLVGRGNWHGTRRRGVKQVALPHRPSSYLRVFPFPFFSFIFASPPPPWLFLSYLSSILFRSFTASEPPFPFWEDISECLVLHLSVLRIRKLDSGHRPLSFSILAY